MAEHDTLLDLLADPDDAGPPTPAPHRIADRYEVLSLVGAGGMGTVYRVLDTQLDEVVALKTLTGAGPELASLLRSELKLARRVTHPHVVRAFDIGEDDDLLFLTMAYVPGTSLGRHLREHGQLDPGEAVTLGRQIASAVAAAHQAGVLHRDLKPDNVLLTDEPRRALLTDFGISEAMAMGSGRLAGTPDYMAPEQLDGAPADTRTEVWALGAILHEMFTGQTVRGGVTAPPMPTSIARVVQRCLSTAPAQRYPSAEAVHAALAEVSALGALARPTRRAPAGRVVAVAPVSFLGPPDAGYLAEALRAELVDALSTTPGLLVVQDEADTVEAIVETSVRWTGSGPVRVASRLVRPGDDVQVWATRSSCDVAELLPVGEALAQQISEALTVSRPSRAPAQVAPGVTAIYLRARAQLRERWDVDLDVVADELATAVAEHPNDPVLLSLLGQVRARQAFFDLDNAFLDMAVNAVERALAADDSRGEPWTALAQVRMYQGQRVDAARALRRAIARSPGSPEVHRLVGYLLLEAGRLNDAIAHLEAAVADATFANAYRPLARGYAYRSDWDAVLRCGTRLGTHNPFDALFLRARWFTWGAPLDPVEVVAGIDDGLAMLAAERPHSRLDERMLHHFGMIGSTLKASYSGMPVPKQVRTALMGAIRAISTGQLRSANAQFTAESLAFAGHIDDAIDMVACAHEAGLQDILWIERCPSIASLRGDPRFERIRTDVAERARQVLAALDGHTQ